jgi:hypothetical protein
LARQTSILSPPEATWWVAAFATSAGAAAAGAVHHGLGHTLRPNVNQRVWQFTLLALVGTGLCLLQVALHVALTGAAYVAGQVVTWGVAVTCGIAAVRIDKFSAAIGAYGVGMIALLGAAIVARYRYPVAHLGWIATAFALSAAAAGVQDRRIGLGPRFNHNDCYHVVQLAAQGCFYLGAASAVSPAAGA